MWERSQYTFWGADGTGRWDWRPGGPSTPIITAPSPSEAIGEISAEVIEGRAVLSFLNGGRGAVTQTAPYPTGLWTAPRTQVTFAQAPNLYAPVVHPYSTLGGAQLLVSQWINPGPNSTFYGVRQWSGSVNGRIAARGAIADKLVVTADEPAYPGHVGPVSPQWHKLPAQDQIAILSDNCDDRVSRADIAAATHAAIAR